MRALPDPEWRDLAACRPPPDATDADRQARVAVFFAPDGDYRRAAVICASCPVTAECAATAAALEVSHGWWGDRSFDPVDGDSLVARRLRCHRKGCPRPVGASGLRRPGGRWCSLECYRADQAGIPVLHTGPTGDPRPIEETA